MFLPLTMEFSSAGRPQLPLQGVGRLVHKPAVTMLGRRPITSGLLLIGDRHPQKLDPLKQQRLLDQRFGKTIAHRNESSPLVSPRMLATKQCVGETKHNFGWGLLVLEYNDLQCCR
jgi:hypothetical protein